MPPWGIPGGGPLNAEQVTDVVNYLRTIQVPQEQNLADVEPGIDAALDRLETGDAAVEAAILAQRQVVAQIDSAQADLDLITPLAERARAVFDDAGQGLDSDADGLSDAAETELTAISGQAVAGFQIMEPVSLDPEVPDAELAEAALDTLQSAAETDPILLANIAAIETALEEGSVEEGIGLGAGALAELEEIRSQAEAAGVDVPGSVEDLSQAEALAAALETAQSELLTPAIEAIAAGSDPDGDGLSTGAEATIGTQVEAAIGATTPTQVTAITLDPTNPASVGGEPDVTTANRFVGNLESLATTLAVTYNNRDALHTNESAGLAFLEQALETQLYSIDIEGVAEAMGASTEEAERAVGLYNSSCARCHTAGYSAGPAFTQEAGSGGFGPALWDGRPTVQFGEAAATPEEDLLVQFLINGSESETPYGLNGFGSGRMPAFGPSLSLEDIELLARYLRSGNLDGKAGVDVLP
jgi:mono/diheme cytochrome c family protein